MGACAAPVGRSRGDPRRVRAPLPCGPGSRHIPPAWGSREEQALGLFWLLAALSSISCVGLLTRSVGAAAPGGAQNNTFVRAALGRKPLLGSVGQRGAAWGSVGLRPPVLCPRQPVLLWAPGTGPPGAGTNRPSSLSPPQPPGAGFGGAVGRPAWLRPLGGGRLEVCGAPGVLVSWERWQRAGGSGRLGQAVTSRWPQLATARVWLRWLCCLGAGSSLELSLCLWAALCHQFVPTWLHWGPLSPPGPPRGHGSLVPGGLGLHGWWQRAQRVPGPLPCPLHVPSQLRVASRGGAAAGREGWQELGPGRGVRGEPAPPLPPWAGTAPRPRGGPGQSRLLKNGAVVS